VKVEALCRNLLRNAETQTQLIIQQLFWEKLPYFVICWYQTNVPHWWLCT